MTLPGLAPLPPFETFCADVLKLDTSSRYAAMLINKALDGRPLDDDEAAVFCRYTGRSAYTPRLDGFRQALILVGRQAGKTETMGAARLAYEGAFACLTGQRDVTVVGVSQDARAAQRVLFGYVARFFEDSPLLRALVVGRTADSLTLQGNVVIAVLPCRPAALRGLRCRLVVLDEVCHFRSSEDLPLDKEAWRAALPTLLTTGGKLLALSSPYAASGLAYDLHRQHFGRDDSPILVWQSPGTVLHPTLNAEFQAQLREIDPEAARAELDGEFLAGVGQLVDEDTIAACTDDGVDVRPPEPNVQYVAFLDLASGTKAGGDRAAVGIAHRTRDNIAVLDACVTWAPPFAPSAVATEVSNLLTRYRVHSVHGDRWALGLSAELLSAAGLHYREAEHSKSEIYIQLAGAMNSGQARLLDDKELLRELRGLERRRGATRDKVDHRRGGHDDRINAAAGALVLASRPAHAGFAVANIPWIG